MATAAVAAPPQEAVLPAPPSVDWPAALARAGDDDDALLALVRTAAAPLPLRQQALQALRTEAALKLAEREFRGHDRRLHQVAKQRLQAQVAQRQAREQAEGLLQTARSLVALPDVPVNRMTELDRAWQALDAAGLLPEQQQEFARLAATLADSLRERVEQEAQRRRWEAEALAALPNLQATCAACARGERDRAALAAAVSAVRELVLTQPERAEQAARGAQAHTALQQALGTAEALDERLSLLDRLTAAPDAEVGAEEAALGAEARSAWLALPPLADATLAASLEQRWAELQNAQAQRRQVRRTQARTQAREQQQARRNQQAEAWDAALAQAEAALDAGHLAEAQRQLAAIDAPRQAGELPEAQQARLAAAQARWAQLRGWQQWAGSRAREELLLQAEALAAATPAGEPAAATKAAAPAGVDAEVARLSVRQRADLIRTLRQRWKEIDDAGGRPAPAMWRRFDAALVAAGAPVKAHFTAQREARDANLAARQALLDALEADAAAALPTMEDEARPEEPGPEAARRLAAALDRFVSAWRRLGPLEHTVPHAAREALLARMNATVSRVETPLQAARGRASAQRQALLSQARALASTGSTRDLAGEARALQAEWQRQARLMPLARAEEQTLWTEFRAALDAAFQAREAAFQARDAELQAHADERAALIERLRQQADDGPAALRRALAEAEAAWRRCGPAPRQRAAALEAEFRAACEGLRRRLDDSATQAWRATADALDAKLALCLDRERRQAEGATVDAAMLATAWAALPVLPGALEAALRVRAGLDAGPEAKAALDADALLLEIEIAWDLPTPPAFEAARRTRKLLAMKQSLEGRRAPQAAPIGPPEALALLLGRADLDAGRSERLGAVLAAWRRRGPKAGG